MSLGRVLHAGRQSKLQVQKEHFRASDSAKEERDTEAGREPAGALSAVNRDSTSVCRTGKLWGRQRAGRGT